METTLVDILATWPLSIVLTAVGLHVLTRVLLVRTSAWLVPLVIVSILLVNALSFATIQVFPAVNGSRDFIHAVKMGYPTFWVNVLVAGAVELGLRIAERPSGGS
ncbi:MAG: hypothetical protein QM820_61025 [Minicystis sp.]